MPKFLLTLLLVAQAALYYGASGPRAVPLSKPLAEFPKSLGAWRFTQTAALDPESTRLLRADDYLSLDYSTPAGTGVNLFVAYFASPRDGRTPHSPQNCLPGAGWIWTVADTIRLAAPGTSIDVNRYVVSRGMDRAVVLYWYQSRGRVVAGEFRAAALTAWDALARNRADSALVRIVAPLERGANVAAATDRAADFAGVALAALRDFLPR